MDALYPVVILAGGLATRMRPLTEKVPKAMLEVAGRPFVDHQLEQLRAQGITEVVFALGFLGERVEAHVGDGSNYGMKVRYAYDGDTLLGTGGAVKRAAKALEGPFFVLYGDSYLTLDYRDIQRRYHESGRAGLMTVFHNEGRWDTSNVEFRNGTLLVYDKVNRTPAMNYIDYGLEILRPDHFAPYAETAVFDLAEVLTKLVAAGEICGYEVAHRFYEIGSRDGYAELESLLSGRPIRVS